MGVGVLTFKNCRIVAMPSNVVSFDENALSNDHAQSSVEETTITTGKVPSQLPEGGGKHQSNQPSKSPNEAKQLVQMATVKVSDALNVRIDPQADANIVAKLKNDTVVVIMQRPAELAPWVQIQSIAGDLTGWVHGGYLEFEDAVTHTGDKDNSLVPWIGRYEFYEFAPPNQGWSYSIDLSREGSGIIAKVSIDGFQTLSRFSCTTTGSGNTLDVIFDKYLPDNAVELYQPGDIMVSLEKGTEDGVVVYWKKLQPMLEENSRSGITYFSKTALQTGLEQGVEALVGKLWKWEGPNASFFLYLESLENATLSAKTDAGGFEKTNMTVEVSGSTFSAINKDIDTAFLFRIVGENLIDQDGDVWVKSDEWD